MAALHFVRSDQAIRQILSDTFFAERKYLEGVKKRRGSTSEPGGRSGKP